MSDKHLYKIEPVLQSTVWGGNTIKDYYHIDTDLDNVAQVYHVIGLKGHLDNKVLGTNETLSSFYETHRDLFNCTCPVFPIRLATSCNDGKQSYHLHPNNEYGFKHEGTLGKVSGGIAYEPKGVTNKRFMGLTIHTIDELKKIVENNDWDNYRNFIDVRDDQFFHTPAGIIHGGAGGGNMSIVFATNSDISYRAYDFGRNDPNRKLHINEVFDCIDLSGREVKPIDPVTKVIDGLEVTDYYECKGEYVAKRIDVKGEGTFNVPEFYFLLCAKGEGGKINGEEIKFGETVFVPANYGEIKIEGDMRLYFISYKE